MPATLIDPGGSTVAAAGNRHSTAELPPDPIELGKSIDTLHGPLEPAGQLAGRAPGQRWGSG